MIQYRAAAFFGRLYVPEIMMGMLTTDEVQDITSVVSGSNGEVPQTLEDIQQLFELKKEALTPDEIKNANRIIQNREEKSYSKLAKLLQIK